MKTFCLKLKAVTTAVGEHINTIQPGKTPEETTELHWFTIVYHSLNNGGVVRVGNSQWTELAESQ